MQKLLLLTAGILLAGSVLPLEASQYATKKSYNHNHHLLNSYQTSNKGGFQFLKKQALQLSADKQLLPQSCLAPAKQGHKFFKSPQQPSTQKYAQEYKGQWMPLFTGFKNPAFAILLASFWFMGQVNADLDPMGVHMQNTFNARAQQDAIGMANHYAMMAQMSATSARVLANQQAEYLAATLKAQQLKAQQELEVQRLAQLKIQQDLDAQKLQLEQLKAQQKRQEDEKLALEQKRREEQKKLEELKKLEEQEAQQILKEQQKLEELKIKRLQEAKKVEEQKIKQLQELVTKGGI